MKQTLKDAFAGIAIGITNALFGSGGGLIAVPYLKTKNGDTQSAAQAGSVALILPLCLLSYSLHTGFDTKAFSAAKIFLLPGVLGAVLGGLFLKKIPQKPLKIFFSLFMFYASIRMMVGAS